MLLSSRITKLWSSKRPHFNISQRLCIKLKFSSLSEAKVFCTLDEDCDDFLPWLESKAGTEISSVLTIGKSPYGRSLCASKFIQAGECILKVPYNVQITSDDLPLQIRTSLTDKVEKIARLATFLLVEQKISRDSQWTPYLSRLPRIGEIHSTIFWNEEELNMLRCSPVYMETVDQKAEIEKDFLSVVLALKHFPEVPGSITLEEFMHAYALVGSRAWGSAKGLSLIPFADFFNHDGVSEAIVLSDEDKQLSEVVADRNYSPGEEVLISYGRFPNATLLLDFGFTLPHNIHDQVHIRMNIPNHDPLRQTKLTLLQRHLMRSVKNDNGFVSSVDSFIIKQVRSAKGKGKGIPQSLRAFTRVQCCTSPQDLGNLEDEAAENDGRLARRPLENCKEIEAHQILLEHFTQLIKKYDESVKSLETCNISERCGLRTKMARDLLNGELRILKSAVEWLHNYCATLLTEAYHHQL